MARSADRHSGRPDSSDVWCILAARLRGRQSADRLSARVSVPDVGPPRRAAGVERRRAPHEGARLAAELPHRIARHRAGHAAHHRIPMGHWRPGADRARAVEWTVAVTNGTASDPRTRDNNAGKQISGRLQWQPAPGLVLGGSGARGPYVSDAALTSATIPSGAVRSTQLALGADAEYSRDYWLVRGELIWNQWQVPHHLERPGCDECVCRGQLQGLARFLRGRPHRSSRLRQVASSLGNATWDASVTRLETGIGYYLRRNFLGKMTYQHNWRDGGPVRQPRPDGPAAAFLAVMSPSAFASWTLPAAAVLALALAVAARFWSRRAEPCHCDACPGRHGRGPRPCRGSPRAASSRAAAERQRSRHACRSRRAGPAPLGRLSRIGAVAGLPRRGAAARNDGSAQRDASCRTCWRLPSARRWTFRTATTPTTTCSRCRRPKPFDLGRYAAGRSKSVRFDRPGIVRVFCEIHSHMSAFILVFNHRYFAVTAADGRYQIGRVPAGRYTLVAWNEGAIRESRPIVISDDGAAVEADFSLR